MLRSNSRRRHQRESGPYICVAAFSASLLLLLSLFVLHSRLSSSPLRLPLPLHRSDSSDPSNASPLLLLIDDADNDAFDGSAYDRIDVLDNDDLVDDVTNPEDDADPDDTLATTDGGGGYFWDHLLGVKRRAFGRRHGLGRRIGMEMTSDGDSADDDDRRRLLKSSFASDDLPVDGGMRAKMASIRGIEDALLVKGTSGSSSSSSTLLREGWAKWFEAKRRFLRQDRLFGSSIDVLNPMNHPLLQDPDIPGGGGGAGGGTGLTRGDRLVRKAIWKELEGIKFPMEGAVRRGVERKALNVEKDGVVGKKRTSVAKEGEEVYADGKRWGYYPGIDPDLSFSEFVEKFFEDDGGRCELRVFMVWNSPPWTYGVRHQRGVESLLQQHKDACVLVFSETMELDFFRDFVKDGFKVAVAMPNLDELLKDTPLLVFTSVWGEWRKTRYYSIHYSEVIRLAALFKYGGIYLDSDIIVLKSLKSLDNAIGMEENLWVNSTLNGAVMAFGKQSPFIMECMVELYSTYDDTSLRWNGAQLLDRAIKKLQSNNYSIKMLKIKDPGVFFPISSVNIARYFSAPTDEGERYQHDALLKRILNQSMTFHFWNSMTSALVPERGSLVESLLNNSCLYCLDVL